MKIPNSPPGAASLPSLIPLPAERRKQFCGVDLGDPALAGSARETSGGWEIRAGGADMWEDADQGYFVQARHEGDFDVAVCVRRFEGAHLYSKAGLMVRESLAADSAHVMFLVFADDQPRNNNLGAYEMQFRPGTGQACQAIYPAVRPPLPPEFPATFPNAWLRLRREGQRFTAWASSDGLRWRWYGSHMQELPAALCVGPALTSHDPAAMATAVFEPYCEAEPVRP